MRIRTDFGALATGGLLSAWLSLVSVGDGRMHGIGSAPASLDGYALEGLRGGMTYLVLFTLLHAGLRKVLVSGRWAYAAGGAACALACVASQVPQEMWAFLAREGRLSLLVGIAVVAGAVLGFSYRWRAGFEADGDEPADLARVLGRREASIEGNILAGTVSEDRSLVKTATEEYFDGPLQVRTAPPVAFVAALLASGLYALVLAGFGFARDMSEHLQLHANDMSSIAVHNAVDAQLFTILTFGMIAPIPFAGVVLLAHAILRGMNRQSYAGYVLAGAIAPLAISLLIGPLGLIFGVQAMIPLAIAMATYRSMAGLEPKSVKEDIIVRDRRDLVGADHARRTFGRLVRS